MDTKVVGPSGSLVVCVGVILLKPIKSGPLGHLCGHEGDHKITKIPDY